MKNLFKIINYILFAIIIFLGGFIIGKKFDIAIDENDKLVGLQYSGNEQKIRRLVSLIDNQYIDNINSDSLVDDAIRYMLSNLDPHTTYINKETMQRVEEEMQGNYVGIGVQYSVINDTISVVRVLEGSPNNGKLRIGDRILAINDIKIDSAVTTKQISEQLRGQSGSRVNVQINRDGINYNVDLERSRIPIRSVTAQFMVKPKIGYIKLVRFSEKSATEVHSALSNLKTKGMETLIFDLRGNPGGLVTVAEEIADEFLTSNELIVYTQDKDNKKKYIYATDKGLFEKGKVYILIDENTASASEIVSGAIQEYGRGTIVGRRSYGKGLVQREISLGDGSRVRLTVARYFTPSGRSIQRPYDNGKKAYSEEIYERIRRGELYHADSIKVNSDLKFTAPSGKTVYGGGGIVPDVFVPLDTLNLSNWIGSQIDNQALQDFIHTKVMEIINHPMLWNEEIFMEHFDAGIFYRDFMGVLGVNPERVSEENKRLLISYIKSSIANQVFGDNAFYRVWQSNDPVMQEVLRLEGIK